MFFFPFQVYIPNFVAPHPTVYPIIENKQVLLNIDKSNVDPQNFFVVEYIVIY